jgi:hypothetical protein
VPAATAVEHDWSDPRKCVVQWRRLRATLAVLESMGTACSSTTRSSLSASWGSVVPAKTEGEFFPDYPNGER